ncbi:hypothetical protein E1K68_11875 [Pseudomonas sp. B2021]|nr:hypothetical protein [Pseudomonas sp. B2021]TKJ97225.1 hypothetical protein PflCFBP13510_26650 [Pseudomonas fluorescens]
MKHEHPVGASLLAKNAKAPRFFRMHALSLTLFASKLAPTGTENCHAGHPLDPDLPRHHAPAKAGAFSG